MDLRRDLIGDFIKTTRWALGWGSSLFGRFDNACALSVLSAIVGPVDSSNCDVIWCFVAVERCVRD